MKIITRSAIAGFASLSLWLTAPCRGDDLADKGRDVLAKNKAAVVTVQLVIKNKLSMTGLGAQSRESKQEVAGTVIDASGLTVISLSGLDAGDTIESLMGGLLGGSDDEPRLRIDTELADAKILADGETELPAEVVLRDRDLDLAFLRPKSKPSSAMPSVSLTNSASAQPLDQVITLTRLGEAAGRAHAVAIERVSALVQKPRRFYIPDSTMTTTALGSPAFTPDGRIVGIFVTRTVKSSSGAAGSGLAALIGGQSGAMTSIILPADEILKAARQAPESNAAGKDEAKDAAKPSAKDDKN